MTTSGYYSVTIAVTSTFYITTRWCLMKLDVLTRRYPVGYRKFCFLISDVFFSFCFLACRSLTENGSAFLDGILKPHMESLPSYIKDTTDFITKIRQLPPLSEDSFLVTLDVGSLYSNIPHNEGIEAYQYFMRNGCKPEGSIQSIS